MCPLHPVPKNSRPRGVFSSYLLCVGRAHHGPHMFQLSPRCLVDSRAPTWGHLAGGV